MIEAASTSEQNATAFRPEGESLGGGEGLNMVCEIEVFYDGDCPLCLREITMLKRLDRRKRILFTDIAASEFVPENYGKTMEDLMAELHARLPNGDWLSGMEVFRRLYSAVGYGWLVAPTRLPVISQMCDWGYRIFARNRLKLTGRCGSACEISHTSRH